MYVRPLVVTSKSPKELAILESRVKSGRVGQCRHTLGKQCIKHELENYEIFRGLT